MSRSASPGLLGAFHRGKTQPPTSRDAVMRLYFYGSRVIDIAKNFKPSALGKR
jgi:dTDP-glucose pyrophosphorylase